MAFIGASALATGGTTVQPVYASAVAGHNLVAFVTGQSTVSTAFTLTGDTTGWTARQQCPGGSAGSFAHAEIWDKIALGSDTMPTWNGGAAQMTCLVMEWSGETTFDQAGQVTGTVSPLTVTSGGTDGGSGRLIVSLICERNGVANTQTFTNNINGQGVGTGINVLGDNGASSLTSHHRSVYSTSATTGGSADTDAMTWGTSAHSGQCIVSYTLTPSLVTPGNLALILAEYAPLLRLPRLVTPGVLGLVASAFAPTVTATGAVVTANPLPDYIQALQEQVAKGWMPIPPPSKLD